MVPLRDAREDFIEEKPAEELTLLVAPIGLLVLTGCCATTLELIDITCLFVVSPEGASRLAPYP